MEKIKLDELISKEELVNEYNIRTKLNGSEILMRRLISLSDAVSFVDSVVSACFSESGEYMPELFDYAFKYMAILYYTNVSIDSEDFDSDEKYALITKCNIYNLILCNCDNNQIGEIRFSAEKKIEYMCKSNIEKIRKDTEDLDAMLSSLKESIGVISESVSVDTVQKFINLAEKYSENELIKGMIE